MKTIYLITDYKNFFGSKWKAEPYRGGYDKNYLTALFSREGFELIILQAKEVDFSNKDWKNQIILYTSSEEPGLHYKSYLEDIIQSLETLEARVVPSFRFLKAHENKVFMELVRLTTIPKELQTIQSKTFGTLEELKQSITEKKIATPCVIKSATGSMSRGVALANNEKELLAAANKISNTNNTKRALKEKLRVKKYPGYLPESQNQSKFIIQPFIPNLTCDWKVLIYGKKVFILQRNIKKNDFRASGSGYNYKAGSASEFPTQYLDFIYRFFESMDLPNLSLDFAFDGNNPYIIEFQAIYYGTSTQFKSEDYYELINGTWEVQKNTFDQETVFVESIVNYLNR